MRVSLPSKKETVEILSRHVIVVFVCPRFIDYQVPSQRGHKYYTVSFFLATGRWSCGCDHGVLYGKGDAEKPCTHVEAIKARMKREKGFTW